jgi:hypothetical protein
MENIKSIRENNQELYNTLIEYNCIALYNGNLLYTGKYNENYDFTGIDKSRVVLKFDIPNEKQFICLEEHNEAIDQLKSLIPEFSSLRSNPKTYNKAVNISFNLPIYNICEDETILKQGTSIVKIYENLYM